MSDTPNIEMIPVESSNITHLGYDKDNLVMHIQFKDGRKYEYSGVSHESMADLAQAPSIGRHFHKFIRPEHTGRKV